MTQPLPGSHPAGSSGRDGREGPDPAGGAPGAASPGVPFPAAPVGPPPGQPGGWPPPGGEPAPHGATAYVGSVHPPTGRPRKRTLLPWLIGATLLLVAGLGTLVVVLLGGDDGERRSAEPSAGGQEPAPSTAASLDGTAPLPGGGQVSAAVVADEGLYEDSGDVALAWVRAMADGDFRTALDLSCAEVREAASAGADGEDAADVLGDYFYAGTLGGQGFTGGTFDGVAHHAESATDYATFTLELDDGQPFVLLVHVGADGTVCDFY